MLLHTTARLAGDSLDASGLFVRGDIRIPSGSTGLRPFSNASLQGDAGVEVRFTWRSLAVRGVALYSLGGEARHDADFDDDRHATVAVSAGVMLPGIVRLDVASFLVHVENGDTRNMYLLSIDRFHLPLSAASAAAESRFGPSVNAYCNRALFLSFLMIEHTYANA
jgi:hypothetical protein